MSRSALITGITGQDGSYLAEFLLKKNYRVHGLVRRSSSSNCQRIEPILNQLVLHQGDLCDSASLKRVIDEIEPDEVYHLGAMSDVQLSFQMPAYTLDVNGWGTLRLLEALSAHTRFYQASTSELFGKVSMTPQNEKTPFHPRSPYGIAKLYAYWTVINYREAYGRFACNGILFNHESPRRGENFVSRKITMAAAKIKFGLQEKLILGNLEAKRDWGYAADYVEGMWLMLQHDAPDDFVLATGRTATVREFVELAFAEVGLEIGWEEKRGFNRANGKVIIEVSPELYRPAEVELLKGDATKAHQKLRWEPKTSLEELIRIMVQSDIQNIQEHCERSLS